MTDAGRDYHDLLFGVRRSVRYHTRRQAFFESLHTVTMIFALLAGSATIAAFATSLLPEAVPLWIRLLPAVLITVLSAVDLVVGCSGKAWRHASLGARFVALERQMRVSRGGATDAELIDWTDQRLAIEAEEPPVLKVLDTLCHNELLRAMGYPPERQIPVSFWQRRFAQFFDFREWRLKAG